MTINDQKISGEEAEHFIGKNAYYYLRKWTEMEGNALPISMNFDAFVAHFYWAAYRKMYFYSGLTLAILLVAAFADLWFELEKYLIRGMIVLTMILYGAFGNYMYQKHAKNSVITLRKKNFSQNQYKTELIRIGGTSIKSLIILTVCLVISLFIVSLPFAVREVLSRQ